MHPFEPLRCPRFTTDISLFLIGVFSQRSSRGREERCVSKAKRCGKPTRAPSPSSPPVRITDADTGIRGYQLGWTVYPGNDVSDTWLQHQSMMWTPSPGVTMQQGVDILPE